MANEKNITENKATETVQTAKHLILHRELIKDKNGNTYQSQEGKDYHAYVVRGVVRGCDIKVDFAGADKGSYEVLDIVFGDSDTADLLMHDERITDDKTGEVTEYTVYEARTIDEDGIEYRANIKPARKSDKNLLTMLLNQLNAQKKKMA